MQREMRYLRTHLTVVCIDEPYHRTGVYALHGGHKIIDDSDVRRDVNTAKIIVRGILPKVTLQGSNKPCSFESRHPERSKSQGFVRSVYSGARHQWRSGVRRTREMMHEAVAVATGSPTTGFSISQRGVQGSTEKMYATYAQRSAAVCCADM